MSVTTKPKADQNGEKSEALATTTAREIAAWTPRFSLTVNEAVKLVDEKREFFDRVMRKDEHYGPIPGASKKPVLLKPGAELLNSAMGLHPELADAAPPILDYTGDEHKGEPFLQYRRVCRIYRQTGPREGDRMLVAQAEGSCNSWESKHRYRDATRICPACNTPAIIKGKAEYGGGWVCFRKKGGCGATYADDDAAITGQPVGKIKNLDVADLENTILKMADKRALVASTLLATGCSDLFTQDLEDVIDVTGEEVHQAPKANGHKVTITEDQQTELIALNNSLPRPLADKNWEAFLRAVGATMPFEVARTTLRRYHAQQCGGGAKDFKGCEHISDFKGISTEAVPTT